MKNCLFFCLAWRSLVENNEHATKKTAQYKSLQTVARRTIFFNILLLIICFVLIGIFVFYENSLQKQSMMLRESIHTINSMISDLYTYQRAPERRDEVVEAFFEKREMLKTDLRACNHELREIPLQTSNEEVYSMAEIKETITILGSDAREISSKYHRATKLLTTHAVAFLLVLGVSILIILITLLFIRKHLSMFYKKYRSILKQVKALVDYTSAEEIPFRPQWEEEAKIIETAQDIRKQILYDRELSEFQEYGTLESFVPKLMTIIEREVPVDRLAVAFLDPLDNVIAESAATKLDRLELDPGFIEHISRTTLGELVETGKPRIIGDLEEHYNDVNVSTATEKILQEGIRSSLTLPIFIQQNCVGFCFISHTEKHIYSEYHIEKSQNILNVLKQLLYSHYLIQQVISQSANSFVQLMQKKDNETSYHIIRMSRYSYAISRQMLGTDASVTPRFLREILWFAPLHDIGKIGIPDNILLKPAKLDSQEWSVMQGHVDIGAQILQDMNNGIDNVLQSSMLDIAIDIVTGHHEKFDGSGYPQGLKGKAIPLAGRISAVADVFDALTSKRPYKEAFSFEESRTIINAGVGAHFDPDVVHAFENAIQEIQEIYERYKEV
jgi:response regulator RpfG family c-di-GMP phosphodiesterase